MAHQVVDQREVDAPLIHLVLVEPGATHRPLLEEGRLLCIEYELSRVLMQVEKRLAVGWPADLEGR